MLWAWRPRQQTREGNQEPAMTQPDNFPTETSFSTATIDFRRTWPRFNLRQLILGAALVLLGSVITAAAPRAIEACRAAAVPSPPIVGSLDSAEITPEWRWERTAMTFDGMYLKQR